MDICIRELGAVGNGETLNTAVIQKAIDDCHASGGGKVIISGGRYLTGTLILRDNVELHLEASGVLLGSPRCQDYPEHTDMRHADPKKLPRWRSGCLIFAEECSNIGITGPGTIDVNGDKFVVPREAGKRGWLYHRIDAPTPPRVVFFTGCRHIRVEDITMTNQPAGWSFWIHDCDFVTFDKVKVLANVNYPNNDGIHLNCCRNVTVSNCIMTNGDDCIVIRSNNVSLPEDKISERIVVTNCTLTSYAAGILVGFINCGTIRNCSFSNLVMTDCSWGIQLFMPYIDPAEPGYGPSDIGRNATLIENISFSHVIMDHVASIPVQIHVDDNPAVRVQAIRNICFSDIHANGLELPWLKGRADCRLENIQFNDCSFEMTDDSAFPNRFDRPFEYGDTAHHPMVTRYADLRLNNTFFSFR